MKRTLLLLGLHGSILALLYGQLLFWRDPFVGIVVFVGYLGLLGSVWQDIFARVFRMRRRRSVTVIFSFFAALALLGFVSGTFVVLYTLTPFLVWLSYLGATLMTFAVFFSVQKGYKKKIPGVASGGRWQVLPRDWKVFRGYHIVSLVYLLLSASLFVFFFLSKSGEALTSPWQTLSPAVLPLWFCVTALLGLLLFSKLKIKTLLVFVLIHSALTHLYLPMTHMLPWGGDAWRHIAVEQKIMSGELQLPVIAGPEAKWREVLGADVPEALVIPHKYIYGQFWGMTIVLAETMRIDLVLLNIWLLPILWSIVLPFLFFRMGKLLFGSWRNGLWLAWLSALLFPFQALGGLTLPVSLGMLVFFFVLTLWLQYLRDGRRAERRVALVFAVLMIFGYTLSALMLWLVMFLSFCANRIAKIHKRFVRRIIFAGLGIAALMFFPVLELSLGVSALPERVDLFAEGKQLVGQFSGWYYASGIRPHDILSGNVFFNHTPTSAFVSTVFTDWRWHVMAALLFLIGLAGYGLYQVFRKEEGVEWRMLTLASGAIFFGYIFNWFILVGDRSFVRRLDVLFGFFVLLFFLRGFFAVRDRMGGGQTKRKRAVLIAAVLLLSWFGATAYASGPDMRVVSRAEYGVAEAVSSDIQGMDSTCILADTWVLLAVEGLSAGASVGGGFPIDAQFGQVERTRLFTDMLTDPTPEVFARLKNTVSTDTCFFVVSMSDFEEEKATELSEITETKPREIDGFYIWNLSLKKNGEDDSV